jgi:hypothetical protein
MDNEIQPQVLSEGALGELPGTPDPAALLALFKLVGIGPNTYLKVRSGAKQARKLVEDQPNFYVYASRDDMRAALHAYVDKFCDAQGV